MGQQWIDHKFTGSQTKKPLFWNIFHGGSIATNILLRVDCPSFITCLYVTILENNGLMSWKLKSLETEIKPKKVLNQVNVMSGKE